MTYSSHCLLKLSFCTVWAAVAFVVALLEIKCSCMVMLVTTFANDKNIKLKGRDGSRDLAPLG